MMEPNLERFIQAQNGNNFGSSFDIALNELSRGKKVSHWMWYIFPQLHHAKAKSSNAIRFALQDKNEALAYLKHPLLGERYLMVLKEVYRHSQKKSLLSIMGSQTDLDKLYSSLCIFEAASKCLKAQFKEPRYATIHELCHLLLENALLPNPIILELNDLVARHNKKNTYLHYILMLKEYCYRLGAIFLGNSLHAHRSTYPTISAAHKLIAFLEHRAFSPLTPEEISCFEEGELYQLQEKYPIDPDFFAHRIKPKTC